MTVALDRPAPIRAAVTSWRTPETGLWVASTGADYLGMIELRGDAYVAVGSDGHRVGVFSSLDHAKRALDPVQHRGVRADREERADLVGMLIAAATGALALTAAVAGMLEILS